MDMAAMLSGGQRLGLLSTTLNNTSSTLSSSAGINEYGDFEEHGLIEPNLADRGVSRHSRVQSNNKSVVLVKLTDSALKAISEYVKQQVSNLNLLSYYKTKIFTDITDNLHLLNVPLLTLST